MLKIGMLIREVNSLENWEFRIVENIKNDPKFELSLLIQDVRAGEKINLFSIKSIRDFIFNIQISIEKYIYRNVVAETINRNEIINYLNSLPKLKVEQKFDESVDVLSEEDFEIIRNHELDLILKNDFNTHIENLFDKAKYGVWFLAHGDISLKKGPPVFWEILNKKSVISVSLLKLTSEQRQMFIIDKAYFNPNRHWSFVQTLNSVKEASVSLLFKSIDKLEKKNFLISKSKVEFCSINESPTLYNSMRYSIDFFSSLTNKFFQKFLELFGKRFECWVLFIGNGSFNEADLSRLKPVDLPKGEFWADPFLFKYKKEQYVFFESFNYKTRKGKICCGRIEDNNIINVQDVLELDYHLSYPFIFREDEEIFMMPETMQNKRLEIYKCINFPNKWELYTVAFEGEIVADATFYTDEQNDKWLFATKKVSINTDATSELFIYKVDSLKLNKLMPHKKNPIFIDSRIARNAGPFFELEGNLFRPSQCSSDAVYGKALNINKITKLNLEEYEESITKKVDPNFQNGFISIHHLHQNEDMFIFDAAYEKI